MKLKDQFRSMKRQIGRVIRIAIIESRVKGFSQDLIESKLTQSFYYHGIEEPFIGKTPFFLRDNCSWICNYFCNGTPSLTLFEAQE